MQELSLDSRCPKYVARNDKSDCMKLKVFHRLKKKQNNITK